VRVQSALNRKSRYFSANPLTRLPGSPAVEEQVNERIRAGKQFSFLYADIDHFKAYNDNYGYKKGDKVIQDVAGLLMECLDVCPTDHHFIGHIGGDDFVMIAAPECAEKIAQNLSRRFDALASGYYTQEDRAQGFTAGLDRLGNKNAFPLMSLSIAIASNEKRPLLHYAKIAEVTSDIKRYLKHLPGRKGSIYLKDRRTQ
jgi:diguanylate cyclase (GGDEF)-like protein